MNTILPHIQSYLYALIHPYRTHDWLKSNIPLWAEGEELPKPSLAEALGLSWICAIIRAVLQLLLANVVLAAFLNWQNDDGFFYFLMDSVDGSLPYYFLIFSLALDVVFFPVLTLITTELWAFLIRVYASFLHYEGNRAEAADAITTVSLSSYFFYIVPIIGPIFQWLAQIGLLYIGLRQHLGASRILAILILLTPMLLSMALFSLFILCVFCLSAL